MSQVGTGDDWNRAECPRGDCQIQARLIDESPGHNWAMELFPEWQWLLDEAPRLP